MGQWECEERSGEGTRRDQAMDERAHPLAFCHDPVALRIEMQSGNKWEWKDWTALPLELFWLKPFC